MKYILSTILVLLISLGLGFFLFPTYASTQNILVTPDQMAVSFSDVISHPSKWFFYNDVNDQIDNTLGSFVAGPATPPLGNSSIQISVTESERKNLATYQFSGTPLASITTLKYSTYNPSAGNGGSVNRSGYLQFNVDFNGSDTWQKRLVYVPANNGTVVQDQWKEWDAINGGNALWGYSGATWPVDGLPGTTLKTWNQILTQYSGIRIRVSDSFLGIRVGEPYADGYTENIDGFKFGTEDSLMVFNFESEYPKPTEIGQCKNGGWSEFHNPAFKNQGDCVSYIKSNDNALGNKLK